MTWKRVRQFRWTCLFILVSAPALPEAWAAPLATGSLVILTDTGKTRNEVPVLTTHPDGGAVTALLSRGLSGRLLRLYGYEQEYLRRASGSSPEPAYLLLSNQQGGFPRFGFYLDDVDKRHAGYVDLHKSSARKGRFGSMDQIFPHELAHVIVHQLAGESVPGGSNQMHAIGVRTDPRQAFQEGFAEHFQVMAIDDPDADPATQALRSNESFRSMADGQVPRYTRELAARWSPVGPMRMGFLVWFSGTEQVWRYFAVKANAFAHQTDLPPRLLAPGDPYAAYLAQNVLPGSLQAPPKPVGVLLSTEGFVSALFVRWAGDQAIGQTYRDPEFYSRFGALRTEVTPLENCYLKLFHVLYLKKPVDAAGMIDGYKSVYPDEAPLVDGIVREALLGQPLRVDTPLWLANRDFRTGTSLFDQFRCLPRTHTFDLNAATTVDLLGVSGMTRSLAAAVLANAPYADLSDLQRVPGFTPSLLGKFRAMEQEMRRLESGAAEDEAGLSLKAIVWSYAWRGLVILLLASICGTLLYRRSRPGVHWLRSAINALGASITVVMLAWTTTGTGAHIAFLGPILIFGVPAALWQLARRRKAAPAARVLLAWAGAAIPAVLAAYPWF